MLRWFSVLLVLLTGALAAVASGVAQQVVAAANVWSPL